MLIQKYFNHLKSHTTVDASENRITPPHHQPTLSSLAKIPIPGLILGIIIIGFLACVAMADPVGPATGNHHAVSLISSPSLQEYKTQSSGLMLKIMHVLLQLVVVLVAAKLLGALAERCKIPGVLGELGAGMLVGPYALGRFILIPIHGHWVPLFPLPVLDPVTNMMSWPISDEFWFIAQLASITLLFLVGLHTNLKQFFRYVGPASIVAVGGVVVPFFLGAFATSFFGKQVWHTSLTWYSLRRCLSVPLWWLPVSDYRQGLVGYTKAGYSGRGYNPRRRRGR